MQIVQDQNTHRPYHDEHLQMDLREEVVLLDGETVRLTPMEYRLLALLVEHAGIVLTRPVFLMQFGGYSPAIRGPFEARIRPACVTSSSASHREL